MKKLAAALLAAALLVLPAQAVSGAPTVDAAAAVLMEKETGLTADDVYLSWGEYDTWGTKGSMK